MKCVLLNSKGKQVGMSFRYDNQLINHTQGYHCIKIGDSISSKYDLNTKHIVKGIELDNHYINIFI